MVAQPLSVAGAVEFTDGSVEAVEESADEFIDGVDEVPVVEDVEVPEAKEKPSENAIQMGDDVWVEFDDVTSTATISGTGDMWDYLEDGTALLDIEKINPFKNNNEITNVIIEDGVTSIGNYVFSSTKVKK